jgi:hypothetical protein
MSAALRETIAIKRPTAQGKSGNLGNVYAANMAPNMSGASSSAAADADIEKLLKSEASAFQRELEVERILDAFKLKSARPAFLIRRPARSRALPRSPYDILDLDESVKPEDIKRKYRHLSLCEHAPRPRRRLRPVPSRVVF